jgi:hypothetical protein
MKKTAKAKPTAAKSTAKSAAKSTAKSTAKVKDLKPKKNPKGGYITIKLSDLIVTSNKTR